MRQPWHRSKRSTLAIALLLSGSMACLSLGACYSGWKPPAQGPGGTGPGKPGPTTKKVGLALLDVVTFSEEALRDPNCTFVPRSLVELRLQESAARVESVRALLEEMSERLQVRSISVSKQDCRNFQTLELLASQSRELEKYSAAIKRKGALHVKMVVAFGDRAFAYPSSVLLQDRWTVVGQLYEQGFKEVLSVHHFASLVRTGGFVSTWQSFVISKNKYEAKVVENPLPDGEGLQAVEQAIVSSASGFAEWLEDRWAEVGP